MVLHKKPTNMQDRTKFAIISTLVYSDIFNYPLTLKQMHKFLTEKKASLLSLSYNLSSMVEKGEISQKGKYYFLNGRGKISKIRIQRELESNKKMIIANKVAKTLSKIPTVRLVGISGSLSMKNCKKEDDIDLLIVTSDKCLWITRFFVNIVLILMKNKRVRLDNFGMNKICPNMFITTSSLKIKTRDQNLFTAHEVVQLKPIVNKNDTYGRFLSENSWVLKYLPNSFSRITEISKPARKENFVVLHKIYSILLNIIDGLFYSAQYSYMKKRITSEKISQNYALFHPMDKTNFVLNLHEQRYQNYLSCLSEMLEKQDQIDSFSKTFDTPGY